jgi:hypothetical protein
MPPSLLAFILIWHVRLSPKIRISHRRARTAIRVIRHLGLIGAPGALEYFGNPGDIRAICSAEHIIEWREWMTKAAANTMRTRLQKAMRHRGMKPSHRGTKNLTERTIKLSLRCHRTDPSATHEARDWTGDKTSAWGLGIWDNVRMTDQWNG